MNKLPKIADLLKRRPKTVTVRGKGHFPVDMLRYDSCYPNRQGDVVALISCPVCEGDDYNFTRDVVVCSHSGIWTPDRWESFGWTIVDCY